jgi:hypothetical protein
VHTRSLRPREAGGFHQQRAQSGDRGRELPGRSFPAVLAGGDQFQELAERVVRSGGAVHHGLALLRRRRGNVLDPGDVLIEEKEAGS